MRVPPGPSSAENVLPNGYPQTVWRLHREPAPLPADLAAWPEVDLLIRSLGALPQTVRLTALASLHLDWPAERLRIHVLDDVHREEIGAFCAGFGIGYLIGNQPQSATTTDLRDVLLRKALLEDLSSPFIAVFRAGDVPVRSFLQLTMGWFLQDPRLAFVEARCVLPGFLQQPRRSLQQPPTIFRRAALDEMAEFTAGGFAARMRSSLRLRRRGWHAAYLHAPQAARFPERQEDGAFRAADQRPERRRAIRVPFGVTAEVISPDGSGIRSNLVDASSGGVRLQTPGGINASAGDPVTLHFAVLGEEFRLPATILEAAHGELRLQFHPPMAQEQDHLAVLLYIRADAWLHLDEDREASSPTPPSKRWSWGYRGDLATAWRWIFVPLLLVSLLMVALLPVALLLPWRHTLPARRSGGDLGNAPAATHKKRDPPPGRKAMPLVEHAVTLDALRKGKPLLLDTDTPWVGQNFVIPDEEVAQRAVLQLQYRCGQLSQPSRSALLVVLNDIPIARIALEAGSTGRADRNRAGLPVLSTSIKSSKSITLPPELLVSADRLVLRLQLPDLHACGQSRCPSPWVQVMPGTGLLLTSMQIIPPRLAARLPTGSSGRNTTSSGQRTTLPD